MTCMGRKYRSNLERKRSTLPTQTNEPQAQQMDPAAAQATTSAHRMVVNKGPDVLPDAPNSSRRNTLSDTLSMSTKGESPRPIQCSRNRADRMQHTRLHDRDDVREEDEHEARIARRNESTSGLDRTQDTRKRCAACIWCGVLKRNIVGQPGQEGKVARWDLGMVLEAPARKSNRPSSSCFQTDGH
jgi:hypothetical protein